MIYYDCFVVSMANCVVIRAVKFSMSLCVLGGGNISGWLPANGLSVKLTFPRLVSPVCPGVGPRFWRCIQYGVLVWLHSFG